MVEKFEELIVKDHLTVWPSIQSTHKHMTGYITSTVAAGVNTVQGPTHDHICTVGI